MLRNGWIVILCATALSVGAGWVAWATASPIYSSTARVFAITPGGATPLDAYYGHLTSVSRNGTIQQLARSPQVTMRTIKQLDLQESPAELAPRITIAVTDSALIDIVVTGREPDLTRATANAVAQNLVQLSKEMRDVDTASAELVPIDAAEPASRLGSMWKFMIPAGMLGLAISAMLVLGYGLARDKLLGKAHVDHIVDDAVAGKA